jgi:hypothetical protein
MQTRTHHPLAWLFVLIAVLLRLVSLCAAGTGTGVTFSGVSEKLDTGVSTPFDFANTNFSVCFWYLSTNTGSVTGVVNKKPNSAGQGWAIQSNLTSNKLSGLIKDSAGTSTVQRDTSSTMNDASNTEHHVCMFFVTNTTAAINNDITVYVDGVLDQATRGSSGLPYVVSTYPLVFGRRDNGSTLPGSLNDIRIDSPGLSATEILHLYKSKIRGGGQIAHKAAIYLPLNECVHGAALPALFPFPDRSGNGFIGEINTTGALCRHGTGLRGAEGVQ